MAIFVTSQHIQQSPAAFLDIVPGLLEIPRIPWVGYGTGIGRIIHEEAALLVRVAVEDALHIPQVLLIHADEIIISLIITSLQQNRPLIARVHAMNPEQPFHWRIDRIATAVSYLFICRSRRRHIELIRQTFLSCHLPEHKLRHRRPADIAVADEKYLNHFIFTPSYAGLRR